MIFIIVTGSLYPQSQFFSLLSEQSLSLIVLGLSINIFWIVQLPLVTKANIVVDFRIGESGDFKTDELALDADTRYTIYTRIYNAGYSILKNFVVLVYFQKGVTIIHFNNGEYKTLDFVKEFTVQKCQCGVVFTPLKNFQTIPPQEWFLFPIILETSKNSLTQDITVQLYSESSWGVTERITKIKIKEK